MAKTKHKPLQLIKRDAVIAAVLSVNNTLAAADVYAGYSMSIGTRADRLKGHYTPDQVINVWFQHDVALKLNYKVQTGKQWVGCFLLNADSRLIEKFKQNDHVTMDLTDIGYLNKAQLMLDAIIIQHDFITKTNKK